jgi:hypothetical protein
MPMMEAAATGVSRIAPELLAYGSHLTRVDAIGSCALKSTSGSKRGGKEGPGLRRRTALLAAG